MVRLSVVPNGLKIMQTAFLPLLYRSQSYLTLWLTLTVTHEMFVVLRPCLRPSFFNSCPLDPISLQCVFFCCLMALTLPNFVDNVCDCRKTKQKSLRGDGMGLLSDALHKQRKRICWIQTMRLRGFIKVTKLTG